jgi:hypothetical protein
MRFEVIADEACAIGENPLWYSYEQRRGQEVKAVLDFLGDERSSSFSAR